MSVEEDTELRDLVAQTLETNGVLNKIRAELRANVFLALEEQDAMQKKSVSNHALKTFLDTKEGHQAFSLVREFLQFFNLDFTLAVLDPESDYANKASLRDDLASDLNLYTAPSNAPILAELLKKKEKGTSQDVDVKNQNSGHSSPTSPRISSKIPQRITNKNTDKPKDTSTSFSSDKRSGLLSDDIDNEDELLKELGVSPINYTTSNNNNNNNKTKKNINTPSWLEPSTKVKKTDDLSPLGALGSLKDAPPLPGVAGGKKVESPLDVTSPEWDDLMKIDQKISDLGFEVPTDDNSKSKSEKKSRSGASVKESDYNYEDDFNQESSQKSDDDGLSITEEIEDEISIGSFAGSNKGDDLMTTDQTVSQISATGYEYTEDIDAF